ncbi:MAG: PucR family transcriptional regulator ligand-binding domain-containing protein, partial [Thermoleophilia bacterium]|nr:PucR family transcriptional regulator ligand-binding domain-containing protein [Thermoleophilia bacterium]
MTFPTLGDVLALPAFADAELLSGSSRLNEPVTWVHVAEVMDEWRFLSGGELLLSTGVELSRATADERVAYLRSLAEAGAAGLVLELVQWLKEVPPEMLQTARLLEFPLAAFYHEVRFADLTRAAHQRILRPHVPTAGEPALDALLDSLVETGRAAAFVENQLGTLLALPGRPRGT